MINTCIANYAVTVPNSQNPQRIKSNRGRVKNSVLKEKPTSTNNAFANLRHQSEGLKKLKAPHTERVRSVNLLNESFECCI